MNAIYKNHPTFLLNITPMTLFKRKIAANKSCENLLFCLKYTFSFDWQAKIYPVPQIFKHEMINKGENIYILL